MRKWILPGAALLLVVLLWMIHAEGRKNGGGANGPVRDATLAPTGPAKPARVNAADLYNEAAELWRRLTMEDHEMLQDPDEEMHPKVATLHVKIRPIMDLLRDARKADYVDWDVELKQFERRAAEKAQVQMVRNLVQMAFWDAVYEFQVNPDSALGDIAALEKLGRSNAQDMITLDLETSFHLRAALLITNYAGKITPAAGADLADVVSPSAVGQSLQNAMNGEASKMNVLQPVYADPATRNEAESALGLVNDSRLSLSPKEMISEMEWIKQTELELGKTFMEPDAQFQQWWTQKLAQASSKPFANSVMPEIKKARDGARIQLVLGEILDAGLALEQNDQARFKSILDPASDKPFTYTKTANGFELSSKMEYEGRALGLDFPLPQVK